MINKDTIKEIGEMAKLEFSEAETERLSVQLNGVMERCKIIDTVDTLNIEPLYQVNDYKNPIREDIVMDSIPQNQVVKNTVEEQYGYFKIIKVMD